ncbi:serine/threonine protein kinase, partial [bacterium]|nr:serine/threonine protein kinase [bacterium]
MRVGAYDIIEPLGEGGMAEAFLARREGPGGVAKLCVVKRIRADLAGDARFVEAFFEEARVAMSLSHGGLVHTFDFGRDDTGTLFLAMEYADAGDLDALAVAVSRRGSVMPVAAACQILASVLAGLAAAHDARDAFGRPLSLVHRDISPSNILLTRAGEAKLADFGIARAADRVLSTAPGVVKGKAAYVAPEQLKGEPATPASDVYAAGVVLWEILAGRRLRGRGTLGDALAGLDNDVPRVDTIRKDVPRAIAEAVARATARDPKNRHPDAAAFRADLLDAARAANVVLDANAVALLVR